jgi:divinyl protochlorophyllide a 8-vinyl-reductase
MAHPGMTASHLERRMAVAAGADKAPVPGVIGPNALTRLAEAITDRCGEGACRAVFAAAGQGHYLDTPPEAMVDEAHVARLHEALHRAFDPEEAAAISREAGRRTAAYLLAHRIPALAQGALRVLPGPIAARLLVRAIARHAWTFAGSGTFSYAFAPDLTLTLKNAPVARRLKTRCPACAYYAATFEGVFAAMLGPRTRVAEITCQACGDDACRFLLRYG